VSRRRSIYTHSPAVTGIRRRGGSPMQLLIHPPTFIIPTRPRPHLTSRRRDPAPDRSLLPARVKASPLLAYPTRVPDHPQQEQTQCGTGWFGRRDCVVTNEPFPPSFRTSRTRFTVSKFARSSCMTTGTRFSCWSSDPLLSLTSSCRVSALLVREARLFGTF